MEKILSYSVEELLKKVSEQEETIQKNIASISYLRGYIKGLEERVVSLERSTQ